MADITIDSLTSGELRFGNLEVRLAETSSEVQAAQALRYRVFYEEMNARPTAEIAAQKRDFDRYDTLCDHLLVVDHNLGPGAAGVVGTYRLIRRPAAARAGSFYSSDEYDISRIEEYPGEVLELGRSCVDPAYRSRGSMQLLWRGIAAYAVVYNVELMFGCASLPGTKPDALAVPLSYLYYHHLAPPALRPVALPHRYVDMRMLDEHAINPRTAIQEVPPLIKGYLRLGGFVGEGAVVDHQFNTTDVSIVVKTDMITDKYLRHYERRGSALL
ncbi:GNAT family N-acetyltransferase [Aerophototrophica crusticola]|uniref:L-ornithine N(alpha)-acyltransferase n=1 Tax=Aerophototrophica crusticola TaxID=1709002 RepID=A0A858RB34_9PROT|nr:GNAT family N-acetyltransferase [Rhodospirillaceae bacterium B3]